MTSFPPLRFGLVGFGAWGKYHAQTIAANPGARLAAIVAVSEETRSAAKAAYPDAAIFADHRRMLAEISPDLVDITTPSSSHAEIARDAIEAGCHLLVEKPLAITLEDCREIVRLARQRGVHLAVGHEKRLSPQWGEIKRLIDRGVIGEPQYVLAELSRRPYRLGASGWRYDQSRVGSWILEEPVHLFDLARWYLQDSGDPVEIYAYACARNPQRPELHDNFSAMFRCAGGPYAVVSQTLSAFEHHLSIKVSGTRGAVWGGWSGVMDRTLTPTSFLKVFDGEQVQEISLENPGGEVFELREEIARCVKMVRGEAAPAASGQDGIWSAGLCLLAEDSVRRKAPIAIGDLLRV